MIICIKSSEAIQSNEHALEVLIEPDQLLLFVSVPLRWRLIGSLLKGLYLRAN